ncbi:MAG TPA: DUF6600 domain-containing protein [Casimicrobiaceae bacterium]|nr:DUF6600 domain-containing protein [Casimicrobiaceae bacterium]
MPCATSCRAMLGALLLCLAGLAQPAHAQDAADDGPAPRVGRVALSQGALYIAPPDRAREWAAVGVNHPVATGDNLWISGEGRAEVDYGGGQFRLGPDSNVHVSRLDDAQLALFIAEGRVIVRVRALEPGESVRVDTPNAQVDLVRPGLYRVEVSPDPRQTWVIVREGEAGIALPGGVQQVLPGQTATIAGTTGGIAEVREGAGLDGLDTWSADRDRVYEGGRQTATYVSRSMVGYPDLERYGRWQTVPEYGAVWFPTTVVDDWAPYRYGHWVWLAAYGWTWVDDAAWGYAPFHYGRWANVGGHWGWCPGAYVARPVWAPALVAWYGGSGWSYSASVGAPVFGWIPLGWRDPFVPWWGRCGARCYERYNRPYAVNVAERPNQPATYYANWRVPGAITAVPAATLRDTRPVQTSRLALPAQALANAPLLTRAPAVTPGPLSTRVVQPGHGAPLPAGELAARIKPQAVSPFAGGAPARGRTIPAPTATPSRETFTRPRPPIDSVPPASVGVTRVPPAAVAPPREPLVRQPPVVNVPLAGSVRQESGRNVMPPQAVRQAPVAPVAPIERPPRSFTPAPPVPVARPAPAAPVARSAPPAPAAPVVRSAPPAPVHAVPPAPVTPRAMPQPAPPQSHDVPAREHPGQPGGPRQNQG